jgi:hypothetical protein
VHVNCKHYFGVFFSVTGVCICRARALPLEPLYCCYFGERQCLELFAWAGLKVRSFQSQPPKLLKIIGLSHWCLATILSYRRELSILGFWYPWGFLKPIPCPHKGRCSQNPTPSPTSSTMWKAGAFGHPWRPPIRKLFSKYSC